MVGWTNQPTDGRIQAFQFKRHVNTFSNFSKENESRKSKANFRIGTRGLNQQNLKGFEERL